MADVIIKGEEHFGVTTVRLPKIGGGKAAFTEGGGSAELQTKTRSYTPSLSQQSEDIVADEGYDGLEKVSVLVEAVPQGSAATPAASITANPSISVDSNGLISASVSASQNITPAVTPGYVSSGTPGAVSVSGSNTSQLPVRSSSDLSALGPAIVAPAGYYPASATASVDFGTEGTPVATKGAVSDHRVSVTPSVTNSMGYISGSTKTGTPVTVSASELVSGSETKTANGTYDVTNLASLVVNVPASSNFTLLKTESLGTVSTSSTQATDMSKAITVGSSSSTINPYDLLVVETSVNTKTNGRHAATTQVIWLTCSSTIGAVSGATIATATWNCKWSSGGVGTTRANTTKYGIYVNSASVSNGTITLNMYQRYNSTQTGTINGAYTTRVYGIKIYDLIGG